MSYANPSDKAAWQRNWRATHRDESNAYARAHRPPGFKPNTWGKEPPAHGVQSAYVNYGCRCDSCRSANTVYYRNRRPAEPEQGGS